MLTPWAIYRGKVLYVDAVGNPYVEVAAVGGPGIPLGPCEQVVVAGAAPLAVGDRVLVSCVARHQDDIVIIGKLNAIAPQTT